VSNDFASPPAALSRLANVRTVVWSKQIHHLDLTFQTLLELRVNRHQQQGVSAQIEEVVVEPHTVGSQNFLPDVRNRRFKLVTDGCTSVALVSAQDLVARLGLSFH